MPGADPKLKPQHIKFIDEFMKDFNASRAYKKAGFKAKQHAAAAHELLRNPKVLAEIDRRKELTRTSETFKVMSREEWLAELQAIAKSNIKNVCKWNSKALTLTDSSEIPDDIARTISEVCFKDGKTVQRSVKLHDKQRALELIGRSTGYLEGPEDAKNRSEDHSSAIAAAVCAIAERIKDK